MHITVFYAPLYMQLSCDMPVLHTPIICESMSHKHRQIFFQASTLAKTHCQDFTSDDLPDIQLPQAVSSKLADFCMT